MTRIALGLAGCGCLLAVPILTLAEETEPLPWDQGYFETNAEGELEKLGYSRVNALDEKSGYLLAFDPGGKRVLVKYDVSKGTFAHVADLKEGSR